jgi:hypothetical protein
MSPSSILLHLNIRNFRGLRRTRPERRSEELRKPDVRVDSPNSLFITLKINDISRFQHCAERRFRKPQGAEIMKWD